MDEVIARIIEVERQCAEAIEQAEAESLRRIEEHQRACEAKKQEERLKIIASENIRRTRTISEAKQSIQQQSADALKDTERLFADPHLQARLKEEIINILLEA